jgi:hypothetical protein
MNIPSDAGGRSMPAFWGKENSLAEAREHDFGSLFDSADY